MLRYFKDSQRKIKTIGERVIIQFRQHKCLNQASSLTFITLFSLVPLSAVALFLLNTFGIVKDEDSPLIAALNNFLPRYRADEIVSGITEFTNRNLAGLGVGGFLFFLIISVTLFISIEGHFNHIWESRRRLPFVSAFQKYLVFCMLLLIGPLVIWLLYSASTNGLFAKLFPWFSVYCLIALMYVALPNVSVNWKAALIGAFVAGTLFQIARIVFANYFALVWNNYIEIYGTLAMLFILAIWIYVTWIVILMGVELTNSIHQYIDSMKPISQVTNENREFINLPGLIALFLVVAQHYHNGRGACLTSEIAAAAKLPETLVQNIFDQFRRANLVYEVIGDTKGYIPARSLNEITLDSILSSVDNDLTDHYTKNQHVPHKLAELFQEMQDTQYDALKEITVHSLLSDND